MKRTALILRTWTLLIFLEDQLFKLNGQLYKETCGGALCSPLGTLLVNVFKCCMLNSWNGGPLTTTPDSQRFHMRAPMRSPFSNTGSRLVADQNDIFASLASALTSPLLCFDQGLWVAVKIQS